MQELALASRILANEGVLDAFGHVSMRHPQDPNRFLMSRSLAPALVTAADIVEHDLDGNAVSMPRAAACSSSASSTPRCTGRGPTSKPWCTATRQP